MNALKTGFRYGLTAAIVMIFAGAMHGCASDSPTDVTIQASGEPTCYIFNGQIYCKD